jgi:hypothetical protein
MTAQTARYMGATFSLLMCLGALTGSVYTLFWTKLPLILPIVLFALALGFGVQVAYDVKRTWWPLITGKVQPDPVAPGPVLPPPPPPTA